MKRLHTMSLFVLSIFSIALLLAACAPLQFPPPAALDTAALDTSVLRGKRIVIDPGHGGPEKGAVGIRGLTESEVNLSVALHLWGMLKAAGARPLLTRSTGEAVFGKHDYSLHKDLTARAELSNRESADLLISIHHNASTNRKINNLIVFYKAGCSVSRDVAAAVCSALEKSVRHKSARIAPGNFHVLRKTRAPALLGEASFISNKKNEKALSFHRTTACEARGYFLGILHYFRKGVPKVSLLLPKNTVTHTPRPAVQARINAGRADGSVNPATIRALLDGRTLAGSYVPEGGMFHAVPGYDLQNGVHTFCISGRNTAGNTSQSVCNNFRIALPPAQISITPVFPVIPADELSTTALDIRVLDRLGRPVIDGTTIEITASAGTVIDRFAETKNGSARVRLASAGRAQSATVKASSGPVSEECTVRFDMPGAALFTATLRDESGSPVSGARLLHDEEVLSISDQRGFIYSDLNRSGPVKLCVEKQGYRKTCFPVLLRRDSVTVRNLLIRPKQGGVFFGKTVALDPSEEQNVPLLQALAQLVRESGGRAQLTWKQSPAPNMQQRVGTAGRIKADVFIALVTGSSDISVGHYYRSARGELLANLIVERLRPLLRPGGRVRTVHSRAYAIVHTAMPAVSIALSRRQDASKEETASALHRALAEYFSVEP